MKHCTYLFTLIITCLIFACKKDPDVNIDETNITGCPVNTVCTNVYTGFADVKNNQLVTGNYRVFQVDSKSNIAIKSTIYIKAPMNGDTFLLNGDDVRAGKVTFRFNCPVCSVMPTEYVDGSVKGRKLKKDGVDQWLIEASITSAAIGNPSVRFTNTFKNYFIPGVINE